MRGKVKRFAKRPLHHGSTTYDGLSTHFHRSELRKTVPSPDLVATRVPGGNRAGTPGGRVGRRRETGQGRPCTARWLPGRGGRPSGLTAQGCPPRCSQLPALRRGSPPTPPPPEKGGAPARRASAGCAAALHQPGPSWGGPPTDPHPTQPAGGWLTIDAAHELLQHPHFRLDPRLGEGVVVLQKNDSCHTHGQETRPAGTRPWTREDLVPGVSPEMPVSGTLKGHLCVSA